MAECYCRNRYKLLERKNLMEQGKNDEPIELQKEFVETLDAIAREDEEGKLKTVPHSEFIKKLEGISQSTWKAIQEFEEKNPEYKP
tara:strand:+ start:7612 stop:7869 length:258 start_codon:yes stop_codon:yes gene_type:complete